MGCSYGAYQIGSYGFGYELLIHIERLKEIKDKHFQLTETLNDTAQDFTKPMPNVDGHDPFYNEQLRLLKMNQEYARLEYKVRYIQERMHRVKDERMALILNLKLSGKTYKEISKTVNLSISRSQALMSDICNDIRGAVISGTE